MSGAKGEFVVVHNGIIANYTLLKQLLERSGATFTSETDTEVVPHLFEYVWQKRGGRISLGKLVSARGVYVCVWGGGRLGD